MISTNTELSIRSIVLPFVVLLLSVNCTKEITAEVDSVPESEASSSYDIVRTIENISVENKLVQYCKGTWYNTIDYNQEHLYDRINIAFMTDSHLDLGDVNASVQNVSDAIDFCNKVKVPIAVILHGGDLTTKVRNKKSEHLNDLTRFFDMGWLARMPLLYTKGNHDLNTIKVKPEMALTDKDWGNIWFDRAEEQYQIVRNIKSDGQKSGYYYYDLADWKVRIICVDCFDLDITKTNEDGTVLYWGGSSFYVCNEQFNWITSTALNFDDKLEKDWGVIVFMHFYRPTDKVGTTEEPVFDSIFPKFNSMLEAFNTQSTFQENYVFQDNHTYDLSIKADWTRYASIADKPYLICVLSGHIHTDAYYHYLDVNHFVTANQFCGNVASDIRINRVAGTKTQNLFDIYNIDLREKRIRVIRYGAGENCYGEGGDRFLPDGLVFSN